MIKSKKSKRQRFLETFFNALGACHVRWMYQDEKCVAGTAIYDPENEDERQDFIWHAEEEDTPRDEVITLLNHLQDQKLLGMDKLKVPAADVFVPGLDAPATALAFDELFKVKVNMVEEGQETDFYWIHE